MHNYRANDSFNEQQQEKKQALMKCTSAAVCTAIHHDIFLLFCICSHKCFIFVVFFCVFTFLCVAVVVGVLRGNTKETRIVIRKTQVSLLNHS